MNEMARGIGNALRRVSQRRKASARKRLRQSNKLFVECLERREMLATVTGVLAGTGMLSIALDNANESLEISRTATQVTLTSNNNINGAGLHAGVVGLGTQSVTYNQSSIYTDGLDIDDSAAGCSVTFNASTGQYLGAIDVLLDQATTGAITFAGNTDIQGALSARSSANNISQSGGTLTVGQTSTLQVGNSNNITLNAANVFTGAVTVNGGNNVGITSSGTLSLNGVATQGNFTATGNSVSLGATVVIGGNLDVDADGGAGSISGAAQYTVTGNSTFRGQAADNITVTNAANDFSGAVTVTNGNTVSITDANTLTLNGIVAAANFSATANAISLGSTVVVGGNLDVDADGGAGAISGAAQYTVTGTATFRGQAADSITVTNAANSFTGNVTVTNGNVVSVAGTSVSLNGVVTQGNFTVTANAITNLGATNVGGNLNFDADGGAGAIAGAGQITVTGSSTFRGQAADNITVTNASNNFTGAVTVTNGATVQITDTASLTINTATWQTAFTATASNGITIQGAFDTQNNTATLTPGAGQTVAMQGTTSFTFNSTSDFGAITSHGAPNLTGATLGRTFNFTPDVGDQFVIIDNTTADPVTGFFATLPEGTTFTEGGRNFRITYVGGDGNDVAITQTYELTVAAAGAGAEPHVRAYDRVEGLVMDFEAYANTFRGGVRVCAGDVNGDNVDDVITVPGPGGGPHVRVFDGVTGNVIRNFFAFDPAFTGGITVAVGDVNNDGQADIITAAGRGAGPHIKVFNGTGAATPLYSFYAYAPQFLGGVTVAAGDLNSDGQADIITGAGAGAGPHVRAFNGANLSVLKSFYAFDPAFLGGVFVAAGDLNDDAVADIVVGSGASAGPHVRAFDGVTNAVLHSFFPYTTSFRGGVRVGTSDRDDDGVADIVTGPGHGLDPLLRSFSGDTGNQIEEFLIFAIDFTGGLFVGPK